MSGLRRRTSGSLPRSISSNSLHRSRTYTAPISRRDSFHSITNYSSQPRRMTNTVRASNHSAILSIGEELRQLLHAENPPLIKDRRYHFKFYEACFVGHEMVDWLLKKGEVESRAEAVAMMQKLLELEVIHHVCDDHDFKDEKLFYRFRRDDGTYEEPPDTLMVGKGQRIYSRLRTDGSNLIQDRKYHLTSFKQCIVAREFVDWLITRGEVNTREEAVELGKQLLDAGVFRHVCDDHHFKDEYLFFRFKNDEPPKRKSGSKIKKRGSSLVSTSQDDNSSIGDSDNNRFSAGSYESSNTSENMPSGGSNTPPEHEDDYIPMQSAGNEDPGYVRMFSEETIKPPTIQPPQTNRQQSIGKVTMEELLDPDGKYVERSIDVVSDPVGYGFVIRGSRPVYVHTVDPSGPAAAVGLQVGEYLHYVNKQQVLDKSHTDVARIILMGPSTAQLVTFIEKSRLTS